MDIAAAPSSVLLLCRTCRQPPGGQQEAVPVETVLDYHGKSVADMILELTDIVVSVDGRLPQIICAGCMEDLQTAYNFRQRCIESHEMFMNELSEISGGTLDVDDPNLLVLKMEPCEPELMETSREIDPIGQEEQESSNVVPKTWSSSHRRGKGTRRKSRFKDIALKFIKECDGRYKCHFDMTCFYSQKTMDINNFIRHCRTKHRTTAERLGLMREQPPTKDVPAKDDLPLVETVPVTQDLPVVPEDIPKTFIRTEKSEQRQFRGSTEATGATRKLIKRFRHAFYCAIDERSGCKYSQQRHHVPNFIRHFRTIHPKAAACHNISSKALYKDILLPPTKRACKQEKVEPKPNPGQFTSSSSRRFKTGRRVGFAELTAQYVKHKNGRFHCAIDENSSCRYAQARYDVNNFVRHFRTLHPMEAVFKDLVRKEGQVNPERRLRIIKKTPVSMDSPMLLEGCIKLMALHNLPVEYTGWAGFRTLLDPLIAAMEVEINDTNMVQHIHQVPKRMIYYTQRETQTKLVSIQIESIVHDGRHFLTVSANYDSNFRVVSRVLGLIRVAEASPARVLKVKLLELFALYNLSESKISVIVLGNVGSMLGTPEKLRKMFSDSLIKPKAEYGNPEKEDTLLDALATELKGQFEVVRNVVGTVLSALNESVPNTDPTIERIERFLQDLRNPQYADCFVKSKASYPGLWRPQHWPSKFRSIRSVVEQEQFFIGLAQQHPELALGETDWQFLHDYLAAFLPLHRLIENLEQSQQEHTTFSSFYMQCLMVVKEVRGTGNRFSKPISDTLGRRLMVLREQKVFRAALFLDPRFLYFKSVVLGLEQQVDAQNYILNIRNRINALKPDSQTDVDEVKQEDTQDDDMDEFLSEMFGGPSDSERSSTAAVPLSSTITPVLQQLKTLEVEPRQPHDYDVWNHWSKRAESHEDLFPAAMAVLTMPTNTICLERSYAALVLAERGDGLTEQTLDELLLVRLNRTLFEKAIVTAYDWKSIARPQGAD